MIKALLQAPIRFYRAYISPMTPPSCRFTPTCSKYTLDAIELYGLVGVWMGMKRIMRCQPFFEGGHDPVPLPEGHRCSGEHHALQDHEHERHAEGPHGEI